MNSPVLRILAVALALALLAPAHAVEILRWERLPLMIPLVVNQERVVFIDRHIRVGVPASLGDRLRVQSAGSALYLRASAPIEPTRLQLHDADNGTVILIDITAESAPADQIPLEPVQIIEPDATTPPPDDPITGAVPDKTAPRATPIPVLLTRFAAQNLYTPLRTVEPVSGITRVSLRRNLPLDTLLPTLNNLLNQVTAIYRPRLFVVEAGNSFGLFGEFAEQLELTVHVSNLPPAAASASRPLPMPCVWSTHPTKCKPWMPTHSMTMTPCVTNSAICWVNWRSRPG